MAIVVTASVAGCSSDQTWAEGQTHGPWRVVYTGYGQVSGSDDAVTLAPKAATASTTTHAALVVHEGTPASPTTVKAVVKTQRQLREGSQPNPWEVGWLLVRYTDPQHFYSITLKPNGWELGKEDPAYPGSQRFLASGTTPTFPVGSQNSVSVTLDGARIAVSVNGTALFDTTDPDNPYLTGSVGLYTEDAEVAFSQVSVQ